MKSSPAPNLLQVTMKIICMIERSTLERSIESNQLSILQPSTSRHEL